MIRHFDEQLQQLMQKIVLMGSTAESMIASAIRCLVERNEAAAQAVFTKEHEVNQLQMEVDEMTVRRTEKPIEGKVPAKPQFSSPLAGEDSSLRRAKPSSEANLVRGEDDPRPLVRARAGAGSYEEPRDTGRQKKRTGKTGRPGR